MHEFEWIARYFAPLTRGRAEALGLQDDAALLSIPHDQQLVVTTDTINESIHFFAGIPPQYIAHKALATNLSDIAAKGATPYAYSLALSLAPSVNEAWIADFCAGLAAQQDAAYIFLLGGDTTRSSGPLSVTITAFGLVPDGIMLKRSGAQIGDAIWVTGSIGDAYGGLQLCLHPDIPIADEHRSYLMQRYHLPTPRIELGQAIRALATSCLDISDGLLQDAGHIASASHVALSIESEAIPLSDAALELMQQDILFMDLITGGDDYELLFTAPADASAQLMAIANQTGIPITRIGSVQPGSGVTLVDKAGMPIPFTKGGWQHI
jgi:thiamine-monophosphate kinase